MRPLLALAVALVVLPVHCFGDELAAGGQTEASRVRETADWLRSADSEVIIKDGDRVTKVSREAALAALYSDLAGAHYKDARESAEGEELAEASRGYERAKESVAAQLQDAQAATIDPSSLTNSCRDSCTLFMGCVRICAAVAAVRGGRKLGSSEDKTLAGLDVELQETGRGFMARSAGAMRAAPYIRAGRVYERMAQAVKGGPPAEPRTAERELSAREVYEQAGPAVVVIMAAGADGGGELGTGSLIDAKGRVLTNAHVVVRDSTGKPFDKVRFYLKPAKVTGDPKRDLVGPHQARVARFDRALDLALLEPIEPFESPAALTLADSDSVRPGDGVVAIGHPEQGGLWTLTTGVVSTVIADLGGVRGKDAFQTDASINRGNSGGPLLDRRGRVVGINTSMARKAADGLTITSVNFAVRSSVARRWLDGEAVASAPLPKPEASEPAVAEVLAPAPDKPAAKAVVSKPQILTERKPYKIEDTIEQAMAEMEDMEKEMREEIQNRAAPRVP